MHSIEKEGLQIAGSNFSNLIILLIFFESLLNIKSQTDISDLPCLSKGYSSSDGRLAACVIWMIITMNVDNNTKLIKCSNSNI